jgi:hypothetical protein
MSYKLLIKQRLLWPDPDLEKLVIGYWLMVICYLKNNHFFAISAV